MSQIVKLPTPKDFSFKSTLLSHGWSELPPFEFDQELWILRAVIDCGKPVSLQISEAANELQIELFEAVSDSETEKILRAVGHVFRFDEDLREFYKLTKREKHLAWLKKIHAGRLLRSPTVFEDLVKSICTTNCSWSLTKTMVKNLVEKLGETSSDGQKAFPNAVALAKMPVEFFKEEIRAGYRAEYLKELADKIASGNLDVEKWTDRKVSTAELKKEIKTVKGVGNYAAENLLKLLGRYDGLALDSFLRGEFYKKYNDGIACDDKQIERHYEIYANWRGLVIWCEMSEKWH